MNILSLDMLDFNYIKTNILSFIKRHKKTMLILSILAIFIIVALCMPAFAKSKAEYQADAYAKVDTILSGGLVGDAKEILLTSVRDQFTGAWDTIRATYEDIVCPFAYALLGLYLVIGIMEKTIINLENFTWQQFIKPFVMLIVTVLVIKNGLEIVEFLLDFTESMANRLGSTDGNLSAAKEKMYEYVDQQVTGFWTYWGFFFDILLPWAISWVLSLVVKIVCYSHVFELYLKTMLAPISISDMMLTGAHGSGMRFLKSYFATCLRLVILVAISMIYGSVAGDIIEAYLSKPDVTMLGLCSAILVSGIAAATMMFKSGSLAKEVIGAS